MGSEEGCPSRNDAIEKMLEILHASHGKPGDNDDTDGLLDSYARHKWART